MATLRHCWRLFDPRSSTTAPFAYVIVVQSYMAATRLSAGVFQGSVLTTATVGGKQAIDPVEHRSVCQIAVERFCKDCDSAVVRVVIEIDLKQIDLRLIVEAFYEIPRYASWIGDAMMAARCRRSRAGRRGFRSRWSGEGA
jgi:hypothetical protein